MIAARARALRCFSPASLLAVILLWFILPLGKWLESSKTWIAERGAWGVVLFGLAYVLAVLALVPGAAVTIAAGWIFGAPLGTAAVSISSTAAAALAFLIARYLARERIARFAKKSKKFDAFDRAISEGDWKVVALMRLSPLLPFSVSNYLFGLTPVRFWPYVLASWLAMLPGTILYVSLGAAGGMAGDRGRRSPWEWTLLGVGLLASAVVVVWMTRRAHRALEERGKDG